MDGIYDASLELTARMLFIRYEWLATGKLIGAGESIVLAATSDPQAFRGILLEAPPPMRLAMDFSIVRHCAATECAD
jgi:hypothetical protein